MAKAKRRWAIRILKFYIASAIISLTLTANYFRSRKQFTGSPPSKMAKQNNLDWNNHGTWWGKYGKQFRPSGYLDIGSALYVTPIVHYFFGWDVYEKNLCVEGIANDLHIQYDDGDLNFSLLLEPDFARYSWRKNHLEDKLARRTLVVEIDEPIRNNFPIANDLANGDRVKVCGRWVYDRAHDHNEIHPANWVEIMKKGER